MSNILWKNIHLCFYKLKCLPPPQPSSPPPLRQPLISEHPPPEDFASFSAATPTSFLVKNFNSLYDIASSDNSTTTTVNDSFFSSSTDDSDFAEASTPPDLASVYASRRFFFSSPGQSNSIIDSLDSPPPPLAPGARGFTEQKYSSNPYQDFRRSMLEMIEARNFKDLKNDNWEYLHELLLCYLALNPKHMHKFIIEAFTDIVVLLMSRPSPEKPRALADGVRKPRGRQIQPANLPRPLV